MRLPVCAVIAEPFNTQEMPDQQIFFDPERKRWKRLRRILDATAVISTLVVAGFIFNVLRSQRLPELLLPIPKHNYRAPPRTIHPGAYRKKPAPRAPQNQTQTLRYPA